MSTKNRKGCRLQLISNLSMMFGELPLVDRLAAAARAGFDGVEIQFPPEDETEALAAASAETGMPIVLINVPRGPGSAVGLAALPSECAAYRAAVDRCARQARALDVAKVNVLSGRPAQDDDPANCRQVLLDNLAHTADVMQEIGVKVMLEPVNPTDVPGFFLTSLDAALEVLESVDHPNLFLQFDFYHMAITEPDLVGAIGRVGPWIGHVQFADAPGRHEPGTGRIDFDAAIGALRRTGYDGTISAEYNPRGNTGDGLGWMEHMKGLLE